MFIIQLQNLLKYRILKYRSKQFSYLCIYTPVFLLLLNSKVSGQDLDPLQTDRPDQTECPFTVAPKHFQMEIGGVYVKDKEVKTGSKEFGSLLKFGLSDKTEFRFIFESVVPNDETNRLLIQPVTIGFKTKLFEEKGLRPVISFIGHLSLPKSGSGEVSADYFAPAFRFTLQHSLSDKFTLSYNLGLEWDGIAPESEFIYTCTLGYSISDHFSSYAEVFGFVPEKGMNKHMADAGIAYLINNNLQLDLSGGIGINQYATENYISLGFSFRI